MPLMKLKKGQSTPNVADFAVGGLVDAAPAIGSVVAGKGSSAIRELLSIIKGGAKKDPAKVFLSEKMTGPRIPAPSEIRIPKGFSLPPSTPSIPARAPSLVEAAKTQEKVYSQFSPIGKNIPIKDYKYDATRGLEDALTGTPIKKRTPPPLIGKTNKTNTTPLRLTDEVVREIRKLGGEGMSKKEIAQKFGTNSNTVSEIINRLAYQKVK